MFKATFVAFLVLSLFLWSSNDVNSLSDSSGKRSRSAISHKSDDESALTIAHEQDIICSKNRFRLYYAQADHYSGFVLF